MDKLLNQGNRKYFITIVILLFSFIFFILVIFLNNSNVCSNKNSNHIDVNHSSIEVETVKDVSWYISIPKINLNRAEIKESVTSDVLIEFIGHFDDTDIYNGNVCLAAHNRGNKVNYFERLKELEIGDEIKYNCQYGNRVYEVESKSIINVYDFSCLERVDNKNVITLITCVENDPNKRLCIRGVERRIE